MEDQEYIESRLDKIWNDSSKSYHEALHACELGRRGYWFPVNPSHVDILITGINPSFRDQEPLLLRPSSIKDLFNNTDPYWTPLRRISYEERPERVGYGLDYRESTAALDLFYFREKKQNCLRNNILQWSGDSGITFLVDMLRVSQERIENLSPKVIIVKNRESQAYWGKLNSREKECIWMGYEFTPISFDGHSNWEVAKVTGIHSKNISGLSSSSLVEQGTVVLFMDHINQYTPLEERPTPETISKLWSLSNYLVK